MNLNFFFKLKEIPKSNVWLIISLFLTVIQSYIILYSSINILQIQHLDMMKHIYIAILIYFTIMSFLRWTSKNPIFYSFTWLEIVSVIPSWILILFFYNDFYDVPGAIFYKSAIFLRFIPLITILLEEKSFYLKEHYPIFFYKMITYVSISIITFLFAGGVLMSFLYNQYFTKEKENRINQLQNLIKIYNLTELNKLYPKWILKIEHNVQGKLYEIYYYDKELIKKTLIPNVHFTYIQGKHPSEGIYVSFIDLITNKNYLELIYLITSIVMLNCIFLILRHYYKKFIFDPLEKANSVIELRLKGEEIESIDLESLHVSEQDNEIIKLIRNIDKLYNDLREPYN